MASKTPFPAPGAGDPGKFKLKAKLPPPGAPAPVPPPAVAPVVPPAPPLFVTDDPPAVAPPPSVEPPTAPVFAPPPVPPVPKGEKVKTPPPFPVVASTRTGRTAAPIAVPHLTVKAEVLEPERELAPVGPPTGKRGMKVALGAAAAVLVLGVGGFFAWKHFLATPAPAPATAPKPAPTAAAPAATPAANSPAASTPGPTPSETLNKLAQAPAAAINKAQEALAARRANGQNRVDAAAEGLDAPDKPANSRSAAPGTKSATAMTSVAPGIAATTQVEAAPEATSVFRTFVANARVSGVFQGSPSRAVINGKLTRVGETVDAVLGIMFDSVDTERRNLVFKDKTGAIVARKY